MRTRLSAASVGLDLCAGLDRRPNASSLGDTRASAKSWLPAERVQGVERGD